MWLSRATAVSSLFIITALGACGFRLQGVGGYPEAMEYTYVDAEDRYTPFYRKLRIALTEGGVTLTDSPINATTIIRIERDETGQQVLTVSARNVPTEYDVYYRIRYSVWMNGEEVLGGRNLNRRQDYTFNPTEVLGKSREEQMLREALADNLVAQVSRELTTIE
jgi:LPS-assembly lipoprotein